MALEVLLGDSQVGRLELLADGRSTRLVLRPEYRQAAHRPVLSQQFISFRPEYRQPSRMLPFFAHLLPEGALRRIIAAQARLDIKRDWELLSLLGQDLPGAVRLLPALDDAPVPPPPAVDVGDPSTTPTVPSTPFDRWRFSLSGVQLKFSMSWLNDRLTLPAAGMDGKWIVKLGDSIHPDLPELEWSVMQWARMAGMDIPAFRLVPLAHLQGIDLRYTEHAGRSCFAIERFDRAEQRRIHIEDFAQVLAADDKYQGHSHETIGNVIAKICGLDDLREYVRRLVFMILSGNADAHLKNWSLIYPDGVRARLSPAYDQIATVAYPQYDRTLALNFNGGKRFEDASLAAFERFARKLKIDARVVVDWVREDVPRVLDAWRELRSSLPLAPARVASIEQHLDLLARTPTSIVHA